MDKSELQDTHPSNYIRYHKAAADVKKTYDEEKALDDLKDEYKRRCSTTMANRRPT